MALGAVAIKLAHHSAQKMSRGVQDLSQWIWWEQQTGWEGTTAIKWVVSSRVRRTQYEEECKALSFCTYSATAVGGWALNTRYYPWALS